MPVIVVVSEAEMGIWQLYTSQGKKIGESSLQPITEPSGISLSSQAMQDAEIGRMDVPSHPCPHHKKTACHHKGKELGMVTYICHLAMVGSIK
jgi:hypothetical protein